MQILIGIGIVIVGYILGSIPFGMLIVKIKTGKDIRKVESGRTGGTNVVRAAGFYPGLLTAILDIAKGAVPVLIAETLLPEAHLIHVLAPLAAILGHNYSMFMIERDADGKIHFHGGAGGATALGGAVGLWPGILPIVVAVGILTWVTIGIASVTTLGIGLSVIIAFAVGVSKGYLEPVDLLYGIIANFLLIWALRPNIKKLFTGNERVVKYSLNGWLRARKEKTSQK